MAFEDIINKIVYAALARARKYGIIKTGGTDPYLRALAETSRGGVMYKIGGYPTGDSAPGMFSIYLPLEDVVFVDRATDEAAGAPHAEIVNRSNELIAQALGAPGFGLQPTTVTIAPEPVQTVAAPLPTATSPLPSRIVTIQPVVEPARDVEKEYYPDPSNAGNATSPDIQKSADPKRWALAGAVVIGIAALALLKG